jgi:hypothetical protein
MDWIGLVQDRNQWTALVNTAMKLRFRKILGSFFNSCTTCGFSRRGQHEVS